MLRFDGIVLRQGDFELQADFALRPERVTAVIGPSGAGKSTLLAAAAGFLTPVAGRIRVGARDVTDLAPGERPVSVIFQDGNLFPHLDVATNVALGLRPSGRLLPDERSRVEEALSKVGLAGLGTRRPAALSGGQQSRAALARVLLQDRPVVLLDEPFAALGPALRREMLALVEEILAGRTIVIVTHTAEDARSADETVFVDAGVARAPVDTADLLADPPEPLRAYLG